MTELDLAAIEARILPQRVWQHRQDSETERTAGMVIPWRVLTTPDPNIRNFEYCQTLSGYEARWEELCEVYEEQTEEKLRADALALLAEVNVLRAEKAENAESVEGWALLQDVLPRVARKDGYSAYLSPGWTVETIEFVYGEQMGGYIWARGGRLIDVLRAVHAELEKENI